MVPKTKDWIKRLNPDSKLLNFNTGRILVFESQALNKSLETLNTPESSKDSEAEFLTLLPLLKNLQGASPSSEIMPLTFQPHSPKERPGLEDHKTLDHEMYIASLNKSENYKAQPYQYASTSKQILKAKAKPFLPCTHYGFNNHRPNNCRNYPKFEIYGSYDHFTSKHNHVINIRGGVLAESSQSNESLIRVECNTCGSSVHFTLNHNEFDHFKRVIVDEYLRTDNGTEFRNHELESFCDEKGIFQNFSSPYTPEQNGVAERKNRTLIEATRTMLNGSVLSKQIWTEAVKIACYTQNRSIIVKRHDKTPYEIFRERILDINYFYVFGYPMFIHNHKDHLGKFDVKADDIYFLGHSSVLKAFRVYNTRRQQIKETYHVTFDESIEAIKFTNTSMDKIRIVDSSRYPPDKFLHDDDPSRQYQVDSDISYYVIPHGRSLTELTQENYVLEVIVPNEHNVPLTKDIKDPPDLINTKRTHEQSV
uniref:Retrovirus-related Pol polyprotein from transposon TNT 1-94 n=1 Tax=Tanacetum cinerariifolium TaxID=118510 RepID=A0A6L2J1P5_TANCI|nr:retrovirus-related Pol polyprotein from transposon TNT 1-94 [Tanacetum cinerariifolium]